jgi:hypothetical protein
VANRRYFAFKVVEGRPINHDEASISSLKYLQNIELCFFFLFGVSVVLTMSRYNTKNPNLAIEILERTEDIISGPIDAMESTPLRNCCVRAPAPHAFFQDCFELKKLFPLSQMDTAATSGHAEATPLRNINDFSSGIRSTISSSSVASVRETSSIDSLEDEFDMMLSQLPLLDEDAYQMVDNAFPVETLVPISTAFSANAVTWPNKCTMKVSGISKRSRKYQNCQWNERYQELLQFHRQNGHLYVPHSYPPNQKLAQWVKR